MRAALAAGKGDLAYTAVDNAVAMVEIAGVDVVIVSGGEGSQNELIAHPDVKSIKDLRGKTVPRRCREYRLCAATEKNPVVKWNASPVVTTK